MSRRFATVVLSLFMLATLTGQWVPAVVAASPAPTDGPASAVQPIDTAAAETIIPADVAEQLIADATDDCVFCVLTQYSGDGDENVFTIDNTGQVRVDGDIVVNGHHIDGATCTPSGPSLVCYRGLHLFRTGGALGDTTLLSARTISISSGWESGPGTRAHADALAVPCVAHPDPNGYAVNGYPTANVCIGATPITDPLNQPGSALQPPDAFTTPIPARGVGSCPNDPRVRVPTGTVASPAKLSLTQSTPDGPNFIICPGLYPGGFALFSSFGTPVHVDMVPGVYVMLGGGFQVSGVASITGNGVMIYNTNAARSYARPTSPWTGVLPPCIGACQPVTADLTGPSSTNIETARTYMFTLTAPAAPNPSGTVTFYEGDDPLPGCEAQPLTSSGLRQATATCLVTYHAFGRQFITGVYSGDALYTPISDDTFTDVNPNAALGFGGFSICTGAACGAVAPCATPPVPGGACVVLLSAPPEGAPFHGMLMFQERTLGSEGGGLGVVIKPGAGLPACTGNWMTDGVPPDTNPVPQPCGPLGGLNGTVYAPHSRSDACPPGGGVACLHDASVDIRASGVSNLRVIGGQIHLDYAETARFTYGSSLPNLTGLSPAQVWIGLKNSDDVGTNFDLMAEVFENNVPIASKEVDNVPGGGSGFNRAVNRSIALALTAARAYGPGDKLSIRLSVRVAATGHRSGTARLWYNDAGANSLFDATIDGIDTNFYLRDGFVLETSPAPVTSTSKKTIDVFVDRLVGNNPWKPFGTWAQ